MEIISGVPIFRVFTVHHPVKQLAFLKGEKMSNISLQFLMYTSLVKPVLSCINTSHYNEVFSDLVNTFML